MSYRPFKHAGGSVHGRGVAGSNASQHAIGINTSATAIQTSSNTRVFTLASLPHVPKGKAPQIVAGHLCLELGAVITLNTRSHRR